MYQHQGASCLCLVDLMLWKLRNKPLSGGITFSLLNDSWSINSITIKFMKFLLTRFVESMLSRVKKLTSIVILVSTSLDRFSWSLA